MEQEFISLVINTMDELINDLPAPLFFGLLLLLLLLIAILLILLFTELARPPAGTRKTGDTRSSVNWERIQALIGGILLVSAGSILMLSEYDALKTLEASKSWPWTMGKVSGARIEGFQYKDGSISYGSVIAYRYTVSGMEYSCRMRLHGSGRNADAGHNLRSYPVGTKIKVLYNPANHGECITVYERENLDYWGYAFLIAISLFFILLGIRLLGERGERRIRAMPSGLWYID